MSMFTPSVSYTPPPSAVKSSADAMAIVSSSSEAPADFAAPDAAKRASNELRSGPARVTFSAPPYSATELPTASMR